MSEKITASLFSPISLGTIPLRNRLVMAPMTRSRAVEHNTPNELMATYYGQRATAGLIITEGTSPSPNGLGYPRIPGLFNAAQVEGWKLTTRAVHDQGGKIFVQLMHTGRVTHPANLPKGAEVLAPSAVQLDGHMYTDSLGPQPYPVPRAMTTDEVHHAIKEYRDAALHAVAAGFDGVELHGANGYLIEQFIHPATNLRTDEFGGTLAKRLRFPIEVARAVVEAIGKERVGMRLSPHGVFNTMPPYDEIPAAYGQLAAELSKLGLVYLHLLDHSSMGTPAVPESTMQTIRDHFHGAIILCGGFDREKAEAALTSKRATLVAFGRPFLANPDLVAKLEHGWPLNAPKLELSYTPGAEGYTDYPVHGAATAPQT